ncbi:zinc metalloproteinase nas-4-like [Pseudomyrmex gracilis]|uniref:zinc metalloproteinase nas-4-like n=1 Tax=Pseudomyrmex gracilis TaxID=219809 RepID=UPI0009951191|nr:zinc metalloproteinase nas-4-like [Pseudomyrmex gracilis]
MSSRSSVVLFLTAFLTAASALPSYRRQVLNDDTIDDLIAHLRLKFGQELYKIPDNDTGFKVANWHSGMNVNPEELGNYAEGDILFAPDLLARPSFRNGLKRESARWPNGVVPFVISPYFNDQQRQVIQDAMDDYHRHTCIRFKPYTGEEQDYIRITAGNTGCWSSVGRIGGRQDVNLQVPGCLTQKGTVMHELMHAVGFLHEQSRYERDDYVYIQWQNIMTGRDNNFEKASKQTTDAFGVGYDYGSVMHYSANAFSKNGQPTIVPRHQQPSGGILEIIGGIFDVNNNAIQQLGQRKGFSKKDILKIRRMYKCNGQHTSRDRSDYDSAINFGFF